MRLPFASCARARSMGVHACTDTNRASHPRAQARVSRFRSGKCDLQASGWVAATRLICSWTPEDMRGASLGALAFSARVRAVVAPAFAPLVAASRVRAAFLTSLGSGRGSRARQGPRMHLATRFACTDSFCTLLSKCSVRAELHSIRSLGTAPHLGMHLADQTAWMALPQFPCPAADWLMAGGALLGLM